MTSGALCKALAVKFKLTRQEAFEIVSRFCGISKAAILADRPVKDEDALAAEAAAGQRAKGKPLQYILGEWDFCGKRILCREGVLIPREDTESLVATASDIIKERFEKGDLRVLDLCCGSGCISVALSALLSSEYKISVTAVDIEPAAIELTSQNALLWGAEKTVAPLLYDIIKEPPFGSWDVIISNPPYIRRDDIARLDKAVRKYEPRAALDGGEDGLVFYRRICGAWTKALKPGGFLLFEIAFDAAREVSDILKEAGIEEIFIKNDLRGLPRCVGGRKPR